MIPIERRISDDTRLIDLTVGELKELFESLVPKITPVIPTQFKSEKRLVYGLKGIKLKSITKLPNLVLPH